MVNAKSAAAVYSNQIVLFGCHGLPILLRTADLVDTGACRAGVSLCTGQPRLSVCWVRPCGKPTPMWSHKPFLVISILLLILVLPLAIFRSGLV